MIRAGNEREVVGFGRVFGNIRKCPGEIFGRNEGPRALHRRSREPAARDRNVVALPCDLHKDIAIGVRDVKNFAAHKRTVFGRAFGHDQFRGLGRYDNFCCSELCGGSRVARFGLGFVEGFRGLNQIGYVRGGMVDRRPVAME
jgi:hypothetical protein